MKIKLYIKLLLTLTSASMAVASYADQLDTTAQHAILTQSAQYKRPHSDTILHRIKPGESIFTIFSKLNLSRLDLEKIIKTNAAGKQLENISPGNTLLIKTNQYRQLEELSYQASPFSTLIATRNINNFSVRLNTRIDSAGSLSILNKREELDSNRNYARKGPSQTFSAQAVIQTTLEEAGRQAGLPEHLINQLAEIFAWDIDFASHIQTGDKFTVIYERPVGDPANSEITAAEFVTHGKTYTAVRYEDKDGNMNYYTPDGRAMRKAFLSTPVDYARISSGFNPHRHHPVLNRIRAHKGVDYAARIGTPVKATGNGQIEFVGRKGGYGQVIIIAHDRRYETVYAHLSDFKRGLQEGDKVKQGEVIGYVGQTGLASGPHLHYEFRVDGEHRDPLTAQATQTFTIDSESYPEFRAKTQLALAQISKAKARSLFAKNQQRYN